MLIAQFPFSELQYCQRFWSVQSKTFYIKMTKLNKKDVGINILAAEQLREKVVFSSLLNPKYVPELLLYGNHLCVRGVERGNDTFLAISTIWT